jgi:MFS superfamily sulfate permease-like transporter
VLSLIDVGEVRRYWAWRRTDFIVAVTALVGVLLTTVLAGMVLAVLLSVILVLYRASRPYVAALGRVPGLRGSFGDTARHPDAEEVPGLVIIRPDAPLYYFNANVARTQILEAVAARRPPPAAVLLDLAATSDLDVTTIDVLTDLVADLRGRGIEVRFAQVKGPVRDRMRRTGLMDVVGEGSLYPSVAAAVRAFEAGRAPETEPHQEGSGR